MKARFEHCIRCTVCVENCPVFRVNPDYPGPKQAGPDAERFRLDGIETVDKWITHCTQCRRCDYACPHGVDPSKLILNAQIRYIETHRKTLPQVLFSNFHFISRLGSVFAVLTNFVTSKKFFRRFFSLAGLRGDIPFPRFYFRSLQRTEKKKSAGTALPPEAASLAAPLTGKVRKKRKAAFFHGCYLNSNSPGEGRMIIEVMEKLGIEVAVPDQVCCGLPALGNGDLKKARKFAAENSRELLKWIEEGWDIIYSCTSCGHTLIYDYPEILEAEQGNRIAENTWDLYEYLLMVIEESGLSPELKKTDEKIAYHIPCHLRGRGVPYPAAELLNRIPGLELKVHDTNCCGFSGSYGFKNKNRNTADSLGAAAAETLLADNPEIIISDCGACRMQLSNFTDKPVADPVRILYRALAEKTEQR